MHLTQFYFRTTQTCKRYLKLAFKYLVLFRRRNVSLVPFGAILTLPPPPWDFATAISAEEGPALPTSSVVSHSRCTYESTCKRSDKNPTNSSRALPISLRNSIGVSPPNMFYCCAGETQATAQSQAFTPARELFVHAIILACHQEQPVEEMMRREGKISDGRPSTNSPPPPPRRPSQYWGCCLTQSSALVRRRRR